MNSKINSCNSKQCKPIKKIYNFKAEKLIRQASDNFIYYRDYKKALKQINQSLKTEQENVKALILKGNILFCIDKDTEALECFNKAINIDPSSVEAYGSKAGTLDILGNQKEALLYCEKALENITLKDKYLLPALFDQQIAILIRMKRYEEAKLVLIRSVKSLSKDEGSYLISCYNDLIDSFCKDRKKKLEMVRKISLRLVN